MPSHEGTAVWKTPPVVHVVPHEAVRLQSEYSSSGSTLLPFIDHPDIVVPCEDSSRKVPEFTSGNPTVHPMIASIGTLRSYAMEENWDGEQAEALSEDTIKVARDIAKTIPYIEGLFPPDVSATARGEIDFAWDWNERMLIVGVCPPPDHIVAFAGLFGDTNIRARVPWSRGVSELLRLCLRMLVNRVL